MAHIVAKPGDRIIITNSSLEYDYGKEFTVIESPRDSKIRDCVWATSETRAAAIFQNTSYRIVARKSVEGIRSKLNIRDDVVPKCCPDCHDTGEITLLWSVVICRCRKGG